MNKKNQQTKKSKNLFIKLTLLFVCTLVLVLGMGYAYINKIFNDGMYEKRQEHEYSITDTKNEKDKDENEEKIKNAINILILGTDDGGWRTDVAMLVHYDPYTKTTSMFSVPRDYKITLSSQAQEKLNYYSSFIKFTEIFAYCKIAEMESPSSYITQVIEEMLNIKIDHFVLVNLSTFREAVDAVGGVEVYVPQRMRWSDPLQDLYIDLEPGVQLLDGEKAEGLVRFRQGYDNNGYGDFGRMQMQQYFLTAYVKKVLDIKNISKIKNIIKPIQSMITTDATLTDILLLLNTAKDADFDRINAHTFPGSDSMIEGKYYYASPGEDELKRYFVKQVLTDQQIFETDSKDCKIEVYSSTYYKSDNAEKIVEKLLEDGYDAEYMGVDGYERILKSIIYVPDKSLGLDLKKYFNLSEIRVDEDLDTETSDNETDSENGDETISKKTIKIVVGEVQNIENDESN